MSDKRISAEDDTPFVKAKLVIRQKFLDDPDLRGKYVDEVADFLWHTGMISRTPVTESMVHGAANGIIRIVCE